jgi:hypothetical protein
MNYEEKNSDAKKINEPHADRKKNIEMYDRVMKNVYWVPEYIFEASTPAGKPFIGFFISDSKIDTTFDPSILKHVSATYTSDYKCVTFVWGEKGQYTKTHPLSFSQIYKDYQKNEGFAFEFSALMNRLGETGFVQHRERESDGKQRKFPLHKRIAGNRAPRPELGEEVVLDQEGRVCPIEIWTDVPDDKKQTVHRQPSEWEQLFDK